jgi:hypothetical protein
MKKKPTKRPSKAAVKEANVIISLLKSVMSESEFAEFEELKMNPEKAAVAKRREEESRRMEEFISKIRTMPAGYRLPAGFAKMWDLLIDGYEQEIRKRHQDAGTKPKHLDALIRRGWVTVNEVKLRLESHLKMPAKEVHPIPAVLVNDAGKWEAPTFLNILIKAHPFVRKVTEKLPELTQQEKILQVMKWAKTCRPKNPEDNYYGTILAQSAERLDLFLYEQAFGDLAEFRWMHAAKQSQQFWYILDAAIGFGRNLAKYETYGDGTTESLIQKALVLSKGKRPTGWRQFIEEELIAVRVSKGKLMTPAELRNHLGSNLPNLKDANMTFSDQRCAHLPPITWPQFQIRAKKARQKLDL